MKYYLNHFLKEKGYSVVDLGKKSKVPAWRLALILKEESEPFLSEARKISKALDVDIELIFPE